MLRELTGRRSRASVLNYNQIDKHTFVIWNSPQSHILPKNKKRTEVLHPECWISGRVFWGLTFSWTFKTSGKQQVPGLDRNPRDLFPRVFPIQCLHLCFHFVCFLNCLRKVWSWKRITYRWWLTFFHDHSFSLSESGFETAVRRISARSTTVSISARRKQNTKNGYKQIETNMRTND